MLSVDITNRTAGQQRFGTNTVDSATAQILIYHAESVQLNSRGQRPRNAIRAKYLTLKGSNGHSSQTTTMARRFLWNWMRPFQGRDHPGATASGDAVTGYQICPLRGQARRLDKVLRRTPRM